MLDADLGYAGTPFIATHESLAREGHKRMVINTDADGVALSDLVTGIPANFARQSLLDEGIIDAAGNPLHEGALDVASWKTVWSMGHGCGSVSAVRPTVELIEEMRNDWLRARGD